MNNSSSYYTSIHQYLLENYAPNTFTNFKITLTSISFIFISSSKHTIRFTIKPHPHYNLPTIFFQIYTTDQGPEFEFESEKIDFTLQTLQSITTSPSISILNNHYFIHPCQLTLLAYQNNHNWITLFLSCLNIHSIETKS